MIGLLCGAMLAGAVAAWMAGWWMRWKAPAWGFVDRPGAHKAHSRPVPLGGGVAIWLGVVGPFAVGQCVLWGIAADAIAPTLFPPHVALHVAGLIRQSSELWFLLAAGTVMLILGLVDDRVGLSWKLRIGVQFLVAVAVVAHGWRLALFIDAPALTAALSVVWIVGLINSFNMLDNMDGLSAGVAAIAAAVLATVMFTVPDPQTHLPQLFVGGFLLVLVGSLSGFLWHNHVPARLYMGDGGSYFIGFCLAIATLTGSFAGGSIPPHAVLAPVCALAVPLYDTVSVVSIRLRAGRSPFRADRSHFSHRLVEMGLSKGHAVWTIYLTTATCGYGALLLHQVDTFGAVVISLLVGSVLAIVAILETAGRRNDR
ncbi:MAG: MraY family glycosyltransferase [Pirellulales bacterium]